MSYSSNRESVFRSVYHQNLYKSRESLQNLAASTKDSLDYVQRLGLNCRLRAHSGCVNTVHWNASGQYLLSGSDDQHIAVTNPFNEKVLFKYKTVHRANIFAARFMPQSSDQAIVSCSGDGIVMHTEFLAPYIRRDRSYGSASIDGDRSPPVYEAMETETNLNFFNCHKSGTTYEVLTVPTEPRAFLSCGEDGTVRYFDLREISSCHKTCCKDNILIFSPSAVNAMDLSPISLNYLAVGSCDAVVRIYDRRYLSVIDFSGSSFPAKDRITRPIKAYPIPLPTKRHFRVTCVRYSPEESQLLVSYSSEYLYLFDLAREGIDVEELHQHGRYVDTGTAPPPPLTPDQVTRRLRLRGDWSDTGPDARPERDASGSVNVGQVRPQLQSNIMSRMTEAISRMLSDPRTRLGISGQAQELSAESQLSLLSAAASGRVPMPDENSGNSTDGTSASATANAPASSNATTNGHGRDDERPSTSTSIWRSFANRARQRRLSAAAAATATPSVSNGVHSEAGTGASSDVEMGEAEEPTTTASVANTVSSVRNNGHSRGLVSGGSSPSSNSSSSGSSSSSTSTTTSTISGRSYDSQDEDAAKLNADLAEFGMTGKDIGDGDEDESAEMFNYCLMKYVGHRNARTMIKEAGFWGQNYVMSGSDCGHIFIWDRRSGRLVKLMQGDNHVVNCLQPHPTLPYLASSGIDYDIKVWAPILTEREFDESAAEELMKRNAVMLEQTKDTITVPAAFMIRMLACIHTLRNRERLGGDGNFAINTNVGAAMEGNRRRSNSRSGAGGANGGGPGNGNSSGSGSGSGSGDAPADSDHERNRSA